MDSITHVKFANFRFNLPQRLQCMYGLTSIFITPKSPNGRMISLMMPNFLTESWHHQTTIAAIDCSQMIIHACVPLELSDTQTTPAGTAVSSLAPHPVLVAIVSNWLWPCNTNTYQYNHYGGPPILVVDTEFIFMTFFFLALKVLVMIIDALGHF